MLPPSLPFRLCLPLLEVDHVSVPSLPFHIPFGNRTVPPDFDILSLCPGDSEMEEFRSFEDNSESSNGGCIEEAEQD